MGAHLHARVEWGLDPWAREYPITCTKDNSINPRDAGKTPPQTTLLPGDQTSRVEDQGGWIPTFPSPLQSNKGWNFDLLRRALQSIWLLQIQIIFLPLHFSKKVCFRYLTPGKKPCFGAYLDTAAFLSSLMLSGLGTENISLLDVSYWLFWLPSTSLPADEPVWFILFGYPDLSAQGGKWRCWSK